jgi:hypothetical protein
VTLDEIREALKLKLEEKFPKEFFPAALEPGTTEVP